MVVLRSLFVVVAALVFTACSDSSDSGNGNNNFAACSIPDQNATWFDYLQEDYLFYQDLPSSIDPTRYSTVSAMLNDVRSSQDRFSYVITREEYDSFFNSGSFFGYGFSSNTEMYDDSFVIRYVFAGSGAEAAGLTRGARLTVINGYTVPEIKQQNIDNATLYGPDEEGFTIDITYIDVNGQTVQAQMSKGTVITNTVFAADVINSNAGNIGYLSFQHGFIEPSEAELDSAFQTIAAQQPSQLILDLRYNGGGRISIAEQLGSLVGGQATSGSVFGELTYNDMNQANNFTYRFSTRLNALDVNRVIVLTTPSTCSASEMIINGLDPFIEVVTVGETTCGKPIGMSPQEYCGMVMSAINFKVVNAVGFGDYFDGISSQCVVEDFIAGDWLASTDAIFAEGLRYAETGSCSVTKATDSIESGKANLTMREILFDHLH
ncbi:MAG: S41 family peptidase [Kangiellaceae bacterium]|jgi:C-terminal processing protease CtpA/Prc|nr:S41 family peptidase [Kangiellaceae bacterium]